jgi:glycosyltransferase involved in cell wall biosynthesis
LLSVAPSYGEGPAYYHGVPIHRVASVPFPPYPQIKLAPINPAVGRALRSFGPDLIHAVNPFILGGGAPRYAHRLGIPLVASYHTNIAAYADYYGLGFGEKLTRAYTRRLHNKATLNLCTSEATRRYLGDNGVERLHVWPQGVDTERFHPDKRSKEWRAKLTAGHPESPLLLYVGRLGREKGIGGLTEVLRALPEVRLALVGDGPARRELELKFDGLPAAFSGTRRGEELTAAYASADALAFPSTTETLGLAMLEALSSGLPVVAARAGASHEVVEDGVSGLLYDPRSSGSLIEAVSRVMGDGDLRARLGKGARAAAETRSWEAATRTLRGYYEEALAA